MIAWFDSEQGGSSSLWEVLFQKPDGSTLRFNTPDGPSYQVGGQVTLDLTGLGLGSGSIRLTVVSVRKLRSNEQEDEGDCPF